MPPAGNRFGPNHLSNPFAHIAPAGQGQNQGQGQAQGPGQAFPQPSHLPHHQNPQLQQNLFNASPNNAVNPFSITGGNNVGLQGGFMGGAGAGGAGGGGGLGGGNVGGGSMGGTGGMGLASREAQLAYQHGAQLQEQAAYNSAVTGAGQPKGGSSRIREVWKTNLNSEFELLRNLVDKYPYVSLVSLQSFPSS